MLLDPPSTREVHNNLSIPKFHKMLQATQDVHQSERAAEKKAFEHLYGYVATNKLKEYRNRWFSHISLDACLAGEPECTAQMTVVTTRLISWYGAATHAVHGKKEAHVLGARKDGRDAAGWMKHMMLDCLRFQVANWKHPRHGLLRSRRYGLHAQWFEDMEILDGLKICQRIAEEMGASGEGVRFEITRERNTYGHSGWRVASDFPNENAKTEFTRRLDAAQQGIEWWRIS